MKKLLAALLACTMIFGLTACGLGKTTNNWTDEDFTFTSDSEKVEVPLGKAFIVYEEVSYLTSYTDGSYEEYESEYATNRGLKLGMTFDEFTKLYNVMNGYAVWEIYTGDSNEYTNFDVYTNQAPSEMYDGTNNNVWLDLGFYKENGKWKQLKDVEVQDVWFCDANYDDYDEVVVFGVNFDKWGQVAGISEEHFSYDEDWSIWQGWTE
ncbi:MAG TPA: hypothetical protein VJY54_08780 [Lachnospiraceae bacterium]|nr:hypothetical protein [Lachnospiraceae bacterium]